MAAFGNSLADSVSFRFPFRRLSVGPRSFSNGGALSTHPPPGGVEIGQRTAVGEDGTLATVEA